MAKKGFTIFRFNNGGTITDRYFKNWDAAKDAMDAEIARFLGLGATITSTVDELPKKGKKRVYTRNGVLCDGNMFTAELIVAYFDD